MSAIPLSKRDKSKSHNLWPITSFITGYLCYYLFTAWLSQLDVWYQFNREVQSIDTVVLPVKLFKIKCYLMTSLEATVASLVAFCNKILPYLLSFLRPFCESIATAHLTTHISINSFLCPVSRGPILQSNTEHKPCYSWQFHYILPRDQQYHLFFSVWKQCVDIALFRIMHYISKSNEDFRTLFWGPL